MDIGANDYLAFLAPGLPPPPRDIAPNITGHSIGESLVVLPDYGHREEEPLLAGGRFDASAFLFF